MFLQEQTQRLQRRIKRIEASPRPEMMQSNKIRYEVELERWTSIEEAWKAGKPFAVLGGVDELAQPLGLTVESP